MTNGSVAVSEPFLVPNDTEGVVLSLVGDQYRDRLRRRGRNPSSIKNFERAWLVLMKYSDSLGVAPRELTREQMEEFFACLHFAPTTKKMYLAQIRAAFKYAQERGLVQSNPTIDVELPRVAETMPRILSTPKLREIRDNCHNERQWLMFHLFAYTGCRKNEIRELMWDAVSLDTGTLFVVGKYGRSRLVPIHPVLGEVLSSSKKKNNSCILGNAYGRPLHYTYLDQILRTFEKEATFHDFRRTVASSLDANGVEEGLIMKIMGWAPRTVFDRHYRNIAPERLQHAILKLYADDPL